MDSTMERCMSVILDYMQGVGAPTLRGQSGPHAAGPALTRSSTWSPSPRPGAYPRATSKAPGGEPAQPPPVALSGEGRRGSEARSRSPARSRARGELQTKQMRSAACALRTTISRGCRHPRQRVRPQRRPVVVPCAAAGVPHHRPHGRDNCASDSLSSQPRARTPVARGVHP